MAAANERLHSLQPLIEAPRPHMQPPKYTNRKASFWRVGRVFMFPYAETVGSTAFLTPFNPYEFIRGRDGGSWIHQKNRIFVVISVEQWYCLVLPIATYGRQGVAKPGVNKSQHGVIHTGKDPVYITQDEAACPGLLQLHSIRVVEDEKTSTLDPMSRINYAQVQPVQRNVAVTSIGMVHEHSLPHLLEQFMKVFMASLFHSDGETGYLQPGPSSKMADFTYQGRSPPSFVGYPADSLPRHQYSAFDVPISRAPYQPPASFPIPYPVSHEAIQSTTAHSQRAVGDGSFQLHSHPFNPDTTNMPRGMPYDRRHPGSRHSGPFHPTPPYGG